MGTFRQVINTAGTTVWVAPVTTVDVELWAGGGGGGLGAATFGGGGGGGGQYVKSTVSGLTIGNSYNVVVGTGGAAGANGVNSTFNTTTVVADSGKLGGAGGAASGGTAGAGGTAGTGTTKRNGGSGAAGALTNGGGGGGSGGDTTAGGNGSGATGGAAGTTNGGTGGAGGSATVVGQPGAYPGAGGGGGGTVASTAGGAGAQGKAILTWTAPSGSGSDTTTPTDLATKTNVFERHPGDKTLDASGNARHGTVFGTTKPQLAPLIVSGFGKGVFFDGIDNGANSAGINAGVVGTGITGAFCYEFRVKIIAIAGAESSSGRWGDAASTQSYILGWTNSGSIKGQMRKAAGSTTTLQSAGSQVAPGGTYALALDYDGTKLRLFLDGVMKDSVAASAPQAPDAVTPLWIGRVDSAAPLPMEAIIDEVRLSNTTRYGDAGYTPSATPFTTDANTLLLYHLDDITDMVTPTDVATTSVGYGRTAADTVTPTDVIVKKPQLNKVDSVTPTDQNAKIIGVNKSDSVTPTDLATRTTAYKRTFADTSTPTDAISKRVTKIFADSISGSTPSGNTIVIAPIFD